MPYINTVFISGRFTDLIEERKAVIRSLVNLGIMPITMEQFHADYRDKDDYISERIQEADYIAVIIGKTYGENKDKEEISYTEWEYDLACKLGKKIMAFVCDESPDKSRTDVDLERASKLEKFKAKVMAVPMVSKFNYGDISSLEIEVTNAFKEYGYNDKANSRYSGVWISEISPVSSDIKSYPSKSDEWVFHGKNDYVFGSVNRLRPRNDHRHWKFTGLEFGDQLLISFAEIDVATISAGIMIVKKDPIADAKLHGFYYEFSKLDSENTPIPIPITLSRKVERRTSKKESTKGTKK